MRQCQGYVPLYTLLPYTSHANFFLRFLRKECTFLVNFYFYQKKKNLSDKAPWAPWFCLLTLESQDVYSLSVFYEIILIVGNWPQASDKLPSAFLYIPALLLFQSNMLMIGRRSDIGFKLSPSIDGVACPLKKQVWNFELKLAGG